MENNRSTKKVRFNIIDAMVIAAVFTLMALFIFVFDPFAWFNDNAIYREAYVTYVVEIKNVDEEIIKNIRENDDLFSSDSDDYIGTIANVESLPHYETKTVEGIDGAHQVKVEIAGKKDVNITIHVHCTYESEVGYIISSQQIAVGSKVNLTSSHFSGSGYCISIEE